MVLAALAFVGALAGATRATAASPPSFSPDGRLIVFNRRSAYPVPAQTWVMGADGADPHPIGPPSSAISRPSFTADGHHILFGVLFGSADDGAREDVWEMNLDGSNAHQLVASSGAGAIASPDGTTTCSSA